MNLPSTDEQEVRDRLKGPALKPVRKRRAEAIAARRSSATSHARPRPYPGGAHLRPASDSPGRDRLLSDA